MALADGRGPSLAGDRKGQGVLLVALCLVTIWAGSFLAPPAAVAAPQHFWDACDSGDEALPAGERCSVPRGPAADPNSGEVFVAELLRNRVTVLSPWGGFLRTWGWDVVASGPGDDTAPPEDQFEVCVPADGDVCKSGIEDGGVGQFVNPDSVAIDSAGNVYVFDNGAHRVQKFSPTGEFLLMFGGGVNQGGGTPENPGDVCTAAHVANGDACGSGSVGTGPGELGDVSQSTPLAISADDKVYVGDDGRIQRFDTGGVYQGETTIAGEKVRNLAVDSAGNLYATYYQSSQISKDEVVKLASGDGPAGPPLATFELSNPRGLAVAPNGDVYAFEVKPFTQRIKRFAANGDEIESFPELSDELGGDSLGLAVNEVTGAGDVAIYLPNTSTAFSSTATDFVRAWGPRPEKFGPPPSAAPEIEAQYAHSVTTDGAVVEARIDPRFWQDATFFVEYGEADCASGGCPERVPATDAALGGGTNGFAVTASAFIGGLEPATTYFYRFVVESGGGGPVRGPRGTEALDGPASSFATFAGHSSAAACPNDALRTGPSAALPDCRAYELVSPLDKSGGDAQALARPISTIGRFASYKQASSEGEKLTFSAGRAFGDAVAGPFSSQYIATRGADGWWTHGISPPRGTAIVDGKGTIPFVTWEAESIFEGFTGDLCSAWLKDTNVEPLAAEGLRGHVNLYRRSNCGSEGYEALSNEGPFGPANEYLNHAGTGSGGSGPGLRFQGASEDLSHQVFISGAALAPDRVGYEAKCTTATDAESIAYQWLRNGAPIEGATSPTYTIAPADEGAAIQCQVTATNANAGSTQVSNPARIVAPAPNPPVPVAPATIARPEQSATLAVDGAGGQTLSCDPQVEDWQGSPGFSFQWYRNGVPLAGNGADTATYTVQAVDLDTRAVFQCAVTATNAGGAVVKLSQNRATSPAPSPAAPGGNTGSPAASTWNPKTQLYDLHEGRLELLSVLPNGQPNPDNSVAGTLGDLEGNRQSTVATAVSADGSRVFWTSQDDILSLGPGKLYVRVDGKRTLSVSETVSGDPARFWVAAADGSKALFGSGGCLYVFDVDAALEEDPEPASELACKAPGVMGASEDLGRIYFLSREALASGATAGENNLYLAEGGSMRLVARLDDADGSLETSLMSPINPLPLYRASRVSPDGRFAAFQSVGSPTGYDNEDPVSGKRYTEVYRFDAVTEELDCVSCNPTGARPSGPPIPDPYVVDEEEDILTGGISGTSISFVEAAFAAAALLPTWERELYPSRALSEDGNRVYFHSYEALVPRDTNGVKDVYQWEAPGAGSCRVGGPGYFVQNGGCLHLISTGTSPQRSEFVDASADGSDVFISTSSSIHPGDEGLVDIYDARVGGGFAVPIEPPECFGDACQSIPPPPQPRTPAGAVFSGAGDAPPQRPCGRLARRAARLARKAGRKGASRAMNHAKEAKRRARRCRRASRGGGTR